MTNAQSKEAHGQEDHSETIEWVDIDGFDNYEISRYGQIRNRNTGLILKQSVSQDGYPMVGLCHNGKKKGFGVHRLLALHFIPNPLNLECVDHINNVRHENILENLRWCSKKDNTRKALKSKRKRQGTTYSKYKGVYFIKQGKWRSKIMCDRKSIHLGYFDTEIEACKAYNKKALELFGEFASLNVIDDN